MNVHRERISHILRNLFLNGRFKAATISKSLTEQMVKKQEFLFSRSLFFFLET
jgi:hypothetical protein